MRSHLIVSPRRGERGHFDKLICNIPIAYKRADICGALMPISACISCSAALTGWWSGTVASGEAGGLDVWAECLGRSRSSGGYLLDEPPDMTPSFPRTGVSGHAGAVHDVLEPGKLNEIRIRHDHRLRHTPQRILGNFLDLGRADAKAPHFGTNGGPLRLSVSVVCAARWVCRCDRRRVAVVCSGSPGVWLTLRLPSSWGWR